MAARFDKPDSRWMPVPPVAAKEAVFWCAVLVAVVSGAILVGRMDAVFRLPEPAASSTVSAASTLASVPATPAR